MQATKPQIKKQTAELFYVSDFWNDEFSAITSTMQWAEGKANRKELYITKVLTLSVCLEQHRTYIM